MFKKLFKNQSGFTLLEFTIAFVIAAILLPALITLGVQANTVSQNNSNRALAVNQLKNAVNYIVMDTQMSGSVATTSGNFPLSLSWVNYPSDRTDITYNIINGSLQRSYFFNNVLQNTMTVANNVNSDPAQTYCAWNVTTNSLAVTLTISIGKVSEFRSFIVTPRVIQSSINQIATTTSLTSSLTPSSYGSLVTFTASVSPSVASGIVIFQDGNNTIGTCPLNGYGQATYATSNLSVGTHSITAVYSGDVNYIGSTSSTLNQTVTPPPAPTVTGISPASGPLAGGTTVNVTGTNFVTVTDVNFGGTAATSFTVNSDTSITATSPAGSGTIHVTVTNLGGTSITSSADQFTYVPAPTVTGINPTEGPLAGGTSVTITGTNFTGATGVKFGSTAASSFLVNSATSITATSPSGTNTVDVTVTTPGGTSATNSNDRFTYIAIPTVTGISPTSGPLAGNTAVVITGTNFIIGSTTVKFGSINASSVTVNSSTSITATSPAGSGTVDITVTTPDGTSATSSADQFTYVQGPTVAEVSPNSGPTTGGTSVTITGTNFTGATTVKFGSINASSYTVDSATSITATSPAGSGIVDVTVTTPGGTSLTSSADRFYYGTISFVSFSTIRSSSNSVTPSLPVGWLPNDIFICVIASLDNVNSTMPGGWTPIDSGTNNGTGLRTTIYWKRAVSGDSNPTVAHTGSGNITACIVAYRGCTTSGSPIDSSGTTLVNSSSSTLTFSTSGITTNIDNDWVIEIGVCSNNRSASNYSGTPTPTEKVDSHANNYPSIFIADFSQSAHGSTGSRTCLLSSSSTSNGKLIALIP